MAAFKEKTRSNFLKKATVALALVAGALFFSHRNERKEEAETNVGRPKVERIERNESRPRLTTLARNFDEKIELEGINRKAQQSYSALTPESFDCRLEMKSYAGEEVQVGIELKNIVGDIGLLYGFLKNNHPDSGAIRGNDQWFGKLERSIQQMAKENDIAGMVTLLGELDSLNLAWDEEKDMQTLAGKYLEVYQGTKDSGMVPESRCLIRNLRAVGILGNALEMITDMICKNPGSYQSYIAQVPESFRRQVSLKCFTKLRVRAFEEYFEEVNKISEADLAEGKKYPIFAMSKSAEIITQKMFGVSGIELKSMLEGYADPDFRNFEAGKRVDLLGNETEKIKGHQKIACWKQF